MNYIKSIYFSVVVAIITTWLNLLTKSLPNKPPDVKLTSNQMIE